MANLKELRTRISSVQSTCKITSAMKMIAATRLRHAQHSAALSHSSVKRMDETVRCLLSELSSLGEFPAFLGEARGEKTLLIVMTSERGLCGGFNGNVIRSARRRIEQLMESGKEVSLLCIGRKGLVSLRRHFGPLIMEELQEALPQEVMQKRSVNFASARNISYLLQDYFQQGKFDCCEVIFTRFFSAVNQRATLEQLLPFSTSSDLATSLEGEASESFSKEGDAGVLYAVEPSLEAALAVVFPLYVTVRIYYYLSESYASEQGARMTAMDSATRNAEEMIGKLTLTYNRLRQAHITKELIEIISGAEAL